MVTVRYSACFSAWHAVRVAFCLFLPFYSKSCLDSTSVSGFAVLHITITTAFLLAVPSEVFNLSAVAVGEPLPWYSHITRYTSIQAFLVIRKLISYHIALWANCLYTIVI